MTQDALIPPTTNDILATAGRRQSRKVKPAHPATHLASKHPDGIRAGWCWSCKQPILTGLDDLACAFAVRVDPTPLTALGEALARLAGLATYEVRRGHPVRIVRRGARQILARPAGSDALRVMGAFDVVAAHECGRVQPEACATTSRLQPTVTATTVDDRCPY